MFPSVCPICTCPPTKSEDINWYIVLALKQLKQKNMYIHMYTYTIVYLSYIFVLYL